ncbi:zinc finger protein ZAT4-like [Panicum miliaceum]|uniref:Zinc finger protein ZAT4-like n=1 Tax=Panicum miliaceum TaxID=4540 RepID=A0A3L6TJK0_PANMI|nr:zinc finger protein ZAT4-like [Panicum miliaceum]
MDRHTCKLCFRRFHNGRALGGHMRSHVMAAAVTAVCTPPPLPGPQSPPLSLASTSSTEMVDGRPAQHRPLASCGLRDGAKRRLGIGAPEFSGGGGAAGGESSVVQDGESDTESSPRFAVSRRRSKRARRRRAAPPPDPQQPASSVSDATTEEDVAMSLVMLSRDSWGRSRSGPERHRGPASSEAKQNDGGGADEAEHDHDHDHDVARPRGRHQCGACRKVFRSYQALGGHRASVKKGKGGCVPAPPPPPTPPAAPPSSKARRAEAAPAVIHECPFCYRVFESGQALGGHKRTHMPYAGAPPHSTPARCGDSSGSIDLNVPAAADDDFELSAVYDAEFGSSTRQ